MEKEKLTEYKVTFNFRNDGFGFAELMRNHIKNLTKTPVEYWNLQNYDLKYK